MTTGTASGSLAPGGRGGAAHSAMAGAAGAEPETFARYANHDHLTYAFIRLTFATLASSPGLAQSPGSLFSVSTANIILPIHPSRYQKTVNPFSAGCCYLSRPPAFGIFRSPFPTSVSHPKLVP